MDSDRIIPTTFTVFENTERCIVRNTERLYFHPRTGELILSIEHVRTPRPNRKHLANFPRVAYHRQVNRSCGILLRDLAIDKEAFIGTPTKQWKSVYEM